MESDCPADDPLGRRLRAETGRSCKPVPSPEIVTSAQAAAEYDIAVEAWGERGWRAVARICRWAKEQGMGVTCPAPEGN